MDEPGRIDPFPRPSWLQGTGSESVAGFEIATLYPAIFAIVFFIWLAYTLVAAYHWFRYGHRSFFTIPLLAVHILVSGVLMLIATSGLR